MKITEAVKLARQQMDQHGLVSWKVAVSRSKKTIGLCDYRQRTISLSYYAIPELSDEKVKDTILHEIAHALTPGAGHGAEWKAMCRRIGANPNRVYRATQEEADSLASKAKYTVICNGPHHQGKALGPLHRLTSNYRRGLMKCVKCNTQVKVIQNY